MLPFVAQTTSFCSSHCFTTALGRICLTSLNLQKGVRAPKLFHSLNVLQHAYTVDRLTTHLGCLSKHPLIIRESQVNKKQ